jgi:hypothetical protein
MSYFSGLKVTSDSVSVIILGLGLEMLSYGSTEIVPADVFGDDLDTVPARGLES